jgi:hypothetical protein
MSKEKTPIEELIEISEEFLNIENGLFSRLKFTASDRKKVLAQRIDVAKQYLTKEKEQREEWNKPEEKPLRSGEYLVLVNGVIDIGKYYVNTDEWKSIDRPLPNAYGVQCFRQNIEVDGWRDIGLTK